MAVSVCACFIGSGSCVVAIPTTIMASLLWADEEKIVEIDELKKKE